MLIALWAQDQSGLIGQNGHLPWHLPADLKHFKELTTNNIIVMGRKTYEGMGKKPLPHRQTVVLTHNRKYNPDHDEVLVMSEVADVLTHANRLHENKKTYIVGGAQVYQALENHFDRLIRTTVCGEFTGDTYFPEIDYSNFKEIQSDFYHHDDKNLYDYEITILERR